MNYFELGYTAVNDLEKSQNTQSAWWLLFAAWILVTVATLGSLFFSEVMGVPICMLCWYQRMALYPLVLILAVGLFPYDPRVIRYAAALIIAGWLLALFHLLLIAGIVPEDVQPCVKGIPCSETHIALFGFLNIPALSILTFTLVGILLFFAHKKESS